MLLSLVVWVFLLEFIIYRFDGNSITSNSIDSIYSHSKNFNFKRYSFSYWAIQNFMMLKGYSFHLWICRNPFIQRLCISTITKIPIRKNIRSMFISNFQGSRSANYFALPVLQEMFTCLSETNNFLTIKLLNWILLTYQRSKYHNLRQF
mgnify:CR=1 FL=1